MEAFVTHFTREADFAIVPAWARACRMRHLGMTRKSKNALRRDSEALSLAIAKTFAHYGNPSMNLRRILTPSALCLIALSAAPLLAHAEPGNRMKMTISMKMQMPGMDMPASSHTMQSCVSAKKPDPRQMMQKNKDCTTSDYKEVGDTVSFHMACTGPMPMNGAMTFRIAADGGVHGTTHMTSTTEGQAMVMDTTYEGQRIGACEYTPPAEAK